MFLDEVLAFCSTIARESWVGIDQGSNRYPAVRELWILIDDQNRCSASWCSAAIVIRDLVGNHAFAVLVSLFLEYLDKVSWAPLATRVVARVATQQLQKCYGLNDGSSGGVVNQNRVRVDMIVVTKALERAI